jgi:DNA polymerase III alpha subunit (gram-positive type)
MFLNAQSFAATKLCEKENGDRFAIGENELCSDNGGIPFKLNSDGTNKKMKIEKQKKAQKEPIKEREERIKERVKMIIEKQKKEEKERIIIENNKLIEERKETQYKVDSCILKIFESEEEWSENNARQLCRMAVIDSTNSLMANCILDRGYKKPSSIYASVFNVCERVALKPSWKDKIKYATPLSEYLNKLK